MTLRTKFAVALAAVAAIVAVLVGAATYSTTYYALRNEITVSLTSSVSAIVAGGSLSGTAPPPTEHSDPRTIVEIAQSISPDGVVTHLSGAQIPLPVSGQALALAQGSVPGQRTMDRVDVDGTTYQVLTQSLGGTRGAVQVGRDLDEGTRILGHLAVWTALIGLAVVAVAGFAGWLVAGRITRRLTRLATMAETVSHGGDLDVEFAIPGRDEVGRLSSSLQVMVDRLSASQQAQQRLVQNAGHELRTPLTSLRTNVSVLERFADLSPTSRDRLIKDMVGETRELTELVNELIELAMDRRTEEALTEVDLADLARQVAVRFENRRGRRVDVHGDPEVLVLGRPRALERAIANLLDNALKFDTSGGAIDMEVSADGVDVGDHGPGIDPTEADAIFDRFYRSPAARSQPGSGLGLAIVAEVASAHGGTGRAAVRPEGGARIGFSLGPETFLPRAYQHSADG
jgi:two-component system sensor histidine kinase MprB